MILVVKLGYLQIIKASELSQTAKSQRQSTQVIPSSRGDIVASDGFVLASSYKNISFKWILGIFPRK